MTTGPGGDAATHDPRPAAAPMTLPDAPPAAISAQLPDGNLVVLGGPGSGKTAMLEAAMHDILGRPGGAALLVTSSRQAAVASTDRLLARLERAAGGSLACVTWHAFARGLVTSHADLLLHDPPVVQWGELDPLVGTRAFTDELAELVLDCQRRLISPEDLEERARAGRRPAWARAAAFLAHYLGHLVLADLVDQAGMVVQAGDLLEDHPDVLAATAVQVGTVLVDEAQELDPAQLRHLHLLVAGGARAILAGDPAGTTDAFRGARPGALPALAASLDARTLLLDRSRRLGGPGLDAVRRLQSAGPDAAAPLHGGGITRLEAASFPGPAEEADAIARLLQLAHRGDGVAYGRMAVLFPTPRRMAGPIRRALERHGVPYRLGAGERQLLAEPIVRHLLDLFRLALEPGRADELLPSLLTSPLGGLDPRELRALRRAAVLADRPLAEHVAAPAAELGTAPPIAARVTALGDLLDRVRRWAGELEADRCFWEVWRHAPVFGELVRRAEADPSDGGVARQLDALTAFSRALGLFVDGRPTATMRTYLDVVERADFV